MSTGDLKKLQNFMKAAPLQFQEATSGVLNALAFKTRENDIKVLSAHLVIRDKKFMQGSLQVQKSNPGQSINQQIAYAGSIERPRFSGWKEQQEGAQMKRDSGSVRKRTPTVFARNGSKSKKIAPSNRINSYKKIAKLSSYKNNFQFMLRQLSSRGGGYFDLDSVVKTKNGTLPRGIYRFKPSQKKTKSREANRGRFNRIQSADFLNPPRRLAWRTISLNLLQRNNDIKKIWARNIRYVVKKYS